MFYTTANVGQRVPVPGQQQQHHQQQRGGGGVSSSSREPPRRGARSAGPATTTVVAATTTAGPPRRRRRGGKPAWNSNATNLEQYRLSEEEIAARKRERLFTKNHEAVRAERRAREEEEQRQREHRERRRQELEESIRSFEDSHIHERGGFRGGGGSGAGVRASDNDERERRIRQALSMLEQTLFDGRGERSGARHRLSEPTVAEDGGPGFTARGGRSTSDESRGATQCTARRGDRDDDNVVRQSEGEGDDDGDPDISVLLPKPADTTTATLATAQQEVLSLLQAQTAVIERLQERIEVMEHEHSTETARLRSEMDQVTERLADLEQQQLLERIEVHTRLDERAANLAEPSPSASLLAEIEQHGEEENGLPGEVDHEIESLNGAPFPKSYDASLWRRAEFS